MLLGERKRIPCLSRIQGLYPPIRPSFFLLDKEYVPVGISQVSSHPPVVVLDNSTLESTKPETPTFVCVFCSEQRALSATYSSHAYAQIVAMGILRSLGTLCIVLVHLFVPVL